MSISTSGFVLTENKDVFAVLSTVENTLIELIRKYDIWQDSTSQLPVIECNPNSKHFNIRFKMNNEDRMLMIHFDCDCDYSEYGESKIIWSLNYWGMAEEIVMSICKVMTDYGQVFYEARDCDDLIVEVKQEDLIFRIEKQKKIISAEQKELELFLKKKGYSFYTYTLPNTQENYRYAVHSEYQEQFQRDKNGDFPKWAVVRIM